MSRRCDGRAVRQSRQPFQSEDEDPLSANLVNVTLASEALAPVGSRSCTSPRRRCVVDRGGLDAFLVKAKTEELSQNARTLEREIEKKQAAA